MLKNLKKLLIFAICCPLTIYAADKAEIAKILGWVTDNNTNRCGGYYLDEPFQNSDQLLNPNAIQITSNQGIYALHGTSMGQGKVTITRYGEQITANEAYIYRDPVTNKPNIIELINNVSLRQPNSLVVAEKGQFDIKTRSESLIDILYRTKIYLHDEDKNIKPTLEELQQPHKVTELSAWGSASSFSQLEPKIFILKNATYSTCPPLNPAWQLKASEIKLNKNTGRGNALNARLMLKSIPIMYVPYFNFPIDNRRQTGFLSPTTGFNTNKSGTYLTTPFYWNMAPNYDSTITPTIMSNRGIEITDLFRFLTNNSDGSINASVIPHDSAFQNFKRDNATFSTTDPSVLSELNTLQEASTTRSSFGIHDNTRFNSHWSGSVNYNVVSDDYYLRDLSGNLNEVTQNQLLQEVEINYKSYYWNFLGRLQGYQTLHPFDEPLFYNQYRRLPELTLNGDYPDGPYGLDFFETLDLSHFDILKTPGIMMQPTGNRFHFQPGVSLPFYRSYFYWIPRLQIALTQYELDNISKTQVPAPHRSLPIFDVSSGLNFDRYILFLNKRYRQTLEPEIYYTYVPYRDQSDIPIFDTSVNTLNYDQLFTYNRFSGIDRIGDANQISIGVTTRFIDPENGIEKIRAGIGQILYFNPRRVTLCNDNDPICTSMDVPSNDYNRVNRSSVAGIFNYNVNQHWGVLANSNWNPLTHKLDNQSFLLHYQLSDQKVINFGYNFIRNGDWLTGQNPDSYSANLSQTDLSFAWPIFQSINVFGRWTENWNTHRFQNLLYGLQYDSCCWAARFVAGRTFTNITTNNSPRYDNGVYFQFSLKGFASIGQDPSQVLQSSISGYQTHFGKDF